MDKVEKEFAEAVRKYLTANSRVPQKTWLEINFRARLNGDTVDIANMVVVTVEPAQAIESVS